MSNPQTVLTSLHNGNRIQIRNDTTIKTPKINNVDRGAGAVLQAMLSKMVEDPDLKRRTDEPTALDPSLEYIDAVANNTSLSVAQARGLMDALPDLELSKQIIVSSILSPNDMLSNELIYGCSTHVFGDATQSLVAVIKDYFDNVYKIKKELPNIIGKAIFTDGSYAQAIFPETAIDAAINSNLTISRESISMFEQQMNGPLWIVGNPTSKTVRTKNAGPMMASFESLNPMGTAQQSFEPNVGPASFLLEVTDNPMKVRMPSMLKRIKRSSILNKYGRQRTYSAEYYAQKEMREDHKAVTTIDELYPTRLSKHVNIVDMSALEADKENVGHPVVFTPQCVIPVFEPGSPSSHVGYFIPLDETGNPLSPTGYEDQFLQLQKMAYDNTGGTELSAGAGGNAFSNYGGVTSVLSKDRDTSPTDPEESARLYSELIENELIERLKNGDYNEKHSIAKATSIYRMMFTRACKAMKTQLLYVPCEFMTYWAYDYNENGTGRSLLDKTKTIASLRMINITANAMAAVKGSINHRKVAITLDADDPDAIKSIEQHLDNFSKATRAEFPIGQLSYREITDALQKAGVSVSVTGHPGVPDTKMEVDNSQATLARPDTEFEERLQKQNIMGLGIPPDSVNSATEMEFEIKAVTYNHLSAKINMTRQETTCEHLSDFIRKYTRNSAPLVKQLIEVIDKNRKLIETAAKVSEFSSEQLALLFINYIDISLPEADTSKTESELEAYEKYERAVDKYLEAFISDEILNSQLVGEEVGNSIGVMRPVIKAHFMRRYLSNKNVAPELFSLMSVGDMENEYFDVLDTHEEYIAAIMPAFKRFILRTMQMGNQADGVVNAGRTILDAIKEKRGQSTDSEAGGYVDDSGDDENADSNEDGEDRDEDDDGDGDLDFGDDDDDEEDEEDDKDDKDDDDDDDLGL